MRRHLILLTGLLVALVSCAKNETPSYVCTAGDEVELEIGFNDLPLSKSSIRADENEVCDWNLYAYLNGSLYLERYSSDGDRIRLASGCEYHFYLLANAGKIRAPQKEADIDKLEFRAAGLNSFNENGFPMCCSDVIAVSDSDTRLEFTLNKLIARYDFKIDDKSLEKTSFSISSVSVCQSALNVFPFSSSSAATIVGDCDFASDEDVSVLAGGGTVSFYMLENCQGNLLPDNRDEWMKVPENLGGKQNLCTYLSVKGKWAKLGADADIEYRMYLGNDNHSDFNVVRNRTYQVTLNLTDDGSSRVSWRVEKTNLRDLTYYKFTNKHLYAFYEGIRATRIIARPEGCEFKLSWNEDKVKKWYANIYLDGKYLVVDTRRTFNNDTLNVYLYSSDDVLKDMMTIDLIPDFSYVIFDQEGCVLGPGQSYYPSVSCNPTMGNALYYSSLSSDNEDVAKAAKDENADSFIRLDARSPGTANICVTEHGHPEYLGVYVTPNIRALDGIPASGETIEMKVGETRSFHLSTSPANEQSLPVLVSVSSGTSVSLTGNVPVKNEHYEIGDIDYGTIYNGVDFVIKATNPGLSTVSCSVEYPVFQSSFKVNVTY